jgi:hypothetical protein
MFEVTPRKEIIIIISVMELGHLLTISCLMYPEVSSKVCHDSFCQLENSVSLLWVIYYKAFYVSYNLSIRKNGVQFSVPVLNKCLEILVYLNILGPTVKLKAMLLQTIT